MAKVYEFLANGFEEIEGLAPVDILRRGGVDRQHSSQRARGRATGAHRSSQGRQAHRCHLCCPYGIGKHGHPQRQEGYLLSWF